MNLLLDTHIWLWWMNEEPRLSTRMFEVIADPENMVYVSSISLWEVAIKSQVGKLRWEKDLVSASVNQNIRFLPFETNHAVATMDLPSYHRDPFDRAILAQAASEGLTLLTVDTRMRQYIGVVNII